MNRTEHLLVILSEECAELSKEISKALRFGLNDHEPNQSITNKEKIVNEFNDLFAVVKMLIKDGVLNEAEVIDIGKIEAKISKVEKWFDYSKKVGTLSASDNNKTLPTDRDIENAAIDYVDQETNHYTRDAKRNAYIEGAKDLRDNKIYIKPK